MQDGMDSTHPDIENIFEAKAARRRTLARLPIEEKVKILVQLQRMAAPLLRARGRDVRIWELDDSEKD
jgi:hypothetical protein